MKKWGEKEWGEKKRKSNDRRVQEESPQIHLSIVRKGWGDRDQRSKLLQQYPKMKSDTIQDLIQKFKLKDII